jgi:DNA (cytosine-5)-methyltransferase 1
MDAGGSRRRRPDGSTYQSDGYPTDFAMSLLPTPAVNDMGEGKSVEWWDSWTDRMRESHGNGNGHGKSLAIEAQRIGAPTTEPSDGGST